MPLMPVLPPAVQKSAQGLARPLWHLEQMPVAAPAEGKVLRIVANMHSEGGGEMSTAILAEHMLYAGWKVVLHPTKHVSKLFRVPAGAEVGPSVRRMKGCASDVLFFYLNDYAAHLEVEKTALRAILKNAGRKYACVNFTVGEAAHPWFNDNLDGLIFLSGQLREVYRRQISLYGTQMPPSVVLAPPVNLGPLLEAEPDYTKMGFARHSRAYKYPKDTLTLVMGIEKVTPAAAFRFMEAPLDVHQYLKGVGCRPCFSMPVPDFLAGASIFHYHLSPSFTEQGPRVIVEAMAAGLPVLCDNMWGARDRVTKETGWVCRSIEDYFSAVKEIAYNRDLLRIKGEAARERAVEHFRVDRWVNILTTGNMT